MKTRMRLPHLSQSISIGIFIVASPPNARLQPPAARNARVEHHARIEGAPTVG
jgi:hypothetical protein